MSGLEQFLALVALLTTIVLARWLGYRSGYEDGYKDGAKALGRAVDEATDRALGGRNRGDDK